MDAHLILEARKFNKNYIAVGDIVDIFTTREDLRGRVEGFGREGLTVDTSKRFSSSTVVVRYLDILRIEIVEEGTECLM